MARKILKLVGVVVIILIAVPLVVIMWFGVRHSIKERQLSTALNKVDLKSSYSEVYSRCGDEEFKAVCHRGYYIDKNPDEAKEVVTALLRNKGYRLDEIPGGYSGPGVAYRINLDGKEVIIRFIETNKEDYKKSRGNIQLIAR